MAEHLDSRSDATGPLFGSAGNQADAVIISAYGRGNWLASELASRGWQVTLADVTESLGPWEPEDAEGPFGLLESADLVPSQKTRLFEEGEMLSVNSGFTLWLKNGPIECRSELSAHHLAGHGIPEAVESYLRQSGSRDKDKPALAKKPFSETWLANLAHQLASTVFEENHLALETGEAAFPIFSPFSIRQVSTAALNKGLKASQASGVKIRQKATVNDLRLTGRAVDIIEIQDNQAGVERGRTYIWMLSSAETERSCKHVAEILFPRGGLVSEWFWIRYRVDFTTVSAWSDDQFPVHTVLLEDPFLPWTHENVIVLRKRSAKNTYDAWVRLPGRARGEREYLEKTGHEIENRLKERMPLFGPRVVGWPAEMRTELNVLGPSPTPVFTSRQIQDLDPLRLTNLFYCGPEHWTFLDWTGQFRAQKKILTKLENLRAIWIAQARKAELRTVSADQRDDQGSASP